MPKFNKCHWKSGQSATWTFIGLANKDTNMVSYTFKIEIEK